MVLVGVTDGVWQTQSEVVIEVEDANDNAPSWIRPGAYRLVGQIDACSPWPVG